MVLRNLAGFKEALTDLGIERFWSLFIQTYLYKKRPDLQKKPSELEIDMSSVIFNFDNLGELYEIALEYTNQISKKEFGQYYTPKDVCEFMAKKVVELNKNHNLVDVCCGTGNLIIEVLAMLNKNDAEEILRKNRLFLYDLDKNALRIAIMKICILFIPTNDVGLYKNIKSHINTYVGNFLSQSISLPKNSIVISNPPYGKLPKGIEIWQDSKTIKTNDMYSVFIEKIALQSEKSVIITPQSYLGGNKFKPLRKALSAFGGSVYSFDNIPCPIFTGRKKGIFNTNTANSVRAAITIVDKEKKGFRVSPMIRFKANERKKMFSMLDDILGHIKYYDENEWTKIPKSLEVLVKEMMMSEQSLADLIVNKENEFKITVPTTPRYFITGSKRDLERSSKITIYAKDKKSFDKLYLILNSTFSYLWWRIYDGGITLTKQTLLSIPVPNLSSKEISELVSMGINMEDDYVVNKLNAGKNNENIKFPDNYRKKINLTLLKELNHTDIEDKLFSLHYNNFSATAPLWI